MLLLLLFPQIHKITAWMRLEAISGDSLFQTLVLIVGWTRTGGSGLYPLSFENLQERRLHNHSQQAIQVFGNPNSSNKKKNQTNFWTKYPVVDFFQFPFLCSEEFDSIFFMPSLQVFLKIHKVLLSLLFSRLISHSSLHFLSLYERYSNPLITFVLLWWTFSSMSMPLLYWESQNRTQHSRLAFS